MRGHLVSFQFCPILLSGVALFLVAFSSSLHTDVSRDEVFERVEGIYRDIFFFRRNINVSITMGENSPYQYNNLLRSNGFGCVTINFT